MSSWIGGATVLPGAVDGKVKVKSQPAPDGGESWDSMGLEGGSGRAFWRSLDAWEIFGFSCFLR